ETSAEATVNLVVDTRPACADPTATAVVGQPVRIPFSAFGCSDVDGGNLLIHPSDGTHGTVESNFATLEVVYTPEPGFAGTDEFEFYASDGVLQSAAKKMRVTVGAPAQATPTPTPITSSTPPPAPADTTAPKATAKALSASIAKGVALTLTSNE